MPNIDTILKEEIRRISKAEAKKQLQPLQKVVSGYRKDIAALKKENAYLKKLIKASLKSDKVTASTAKREQVVFEQPQRLRFSPASVKGQRDRLGLSAADYAKLVGVSALTIYNWEHGKSRPREKQLAALAEVRGIGKREAMRRLEQVETKKS